MIYQSPDGKTRIDVRVDGDTVWLSQAEMAELFQVKVPNVNEHIKNIYAEGELSSESTIRNFRMVRQEGTREVSREIAESRAPNPESRILNPVPLPSASRLSTPRCASSTWKCAFAGRRSRGGIRFAGNVISRCRRGCATGCIEPSRTATRRTTTRPRTF